MLNSVALLLAILNSLSFVAATPLETSNRRVPRSSLEFKRAPGHLVHFSTRHYTIDEHFAKIGQNFTADVYTGSGYHANLTDSQLAAIYTDPNVDDITENTYGKFLHVDEPHSTTRAPVSTYLPWTNGIRPRASTPNVGWGLAYLSERQKSPPSPYTYYYLGNSGEGVDIYIIDSGINPIGPLEGRVRDEKDYTGTGFRDTHNHGTKVASFAGSTKYGTAKKPTLRNYKVDKDGEPDSDYVIQALIDIRKADKVRRAGSGYKGTVINISSSLRNSPNLQDQIENVVDAGIAVVVAAGNDNSEVDQSIVPCRYAATICIGGTDKTYAKSQTSNYGKAVTLFAPGDTLDGYDNQGNEQHNLVGSSFASPYVAGIVATYYGYEGKRMDPDRARSLLNQNAEQGILSGIGSQSPNKLANNGYQKATGGKPYIGAPASPAIACTYAAMPGVFTGAAGYCDCSGSTLGLSTSRINTTISGIATNVVNQCAYTTMPSQTTNLGSTIVPTVVATSQTATPTAFASPICWSPDHTGKNPFERGQAETAIDHFASTSGCQIQLGYPAPPPSDNNQGCLDKFAIDLSNLDSNSAAVISMSVEQIFWEVGQPTYDLVQSELKDVMYTIMDDCDTDTTKDKYGGWTVVGDDTNGYRRYNLTGSQALDVVPTGFAGVTNDNGAR